MWQYLRKKVEMPTADKALRGGVETINDRRALEILQREFPRHRVVGIDSTELIWGLGSFHCISQQEPA